MLGILMIINEITDVYLIGDSKVIGSYVIIAIYLITIGVIFLLMRWNKVTRADVGLRKIQYDRKNVISYVLMFSMLMYGVSVLLGAYQYITGMYILMMVLVGIVEELLFRGLAQVVFQDLKRSQYIILSAVIFALAHVFVTTNTLALTIFNAFLYGMQAALFLEITKSLYPLLIFHVLFNIVYFVPLPNDQAFGLYLLQCIHIVYLIYRLKTNLGGIDEHEID
ncbi:MAG: CPBP family intramembrane glutamic endopeptidase [Culicoidibacterales bacterium]